MPRPDRTVPTVKQFSKDAETQRVLSQLERNVVKAVGDVHADKAERYEVPEIHRSSCAAAFGQLVRVDPTGGALTVTLPSGKTQDAGREVIVKNVANVATTITIAPQGGASVDGNNLATMAVAYGAGRFVFDGSNWWVVT